MMEQQLLQYLKDNDGKPQGVTWYEIAEKFDVHVTSGKYTQDQLQDWKDARADKARKFWKKNCTPDKPYTNLKLRRVWEQRSKDGQTHLLHSYENSEVPSSLDIEEVVKKAMGTVTPVFLPNQKIEKHALFIPLSDIHVGAVGGSLFKGNTYNKEEVTRRLDVILNRIHSLGKFERIIIADMGDSLDGYNSKTTRGGHDLDQNMNSREQFDSYFSCLKEFFDKLHYMAISNHIDFIGLSNANHDGAFGYTAQRSLQIYLQSKFPNMNTRVGSEFIQYFTYGDHCYILTHGKDESFMRAGLPLHLNDKTEVYFQRFIDEKELNSKYFTVVKGDLHQQADQRGYKFRYLSCPSFFGGTEYIHTNYGPNRPGIIYDIINPTDRSVIKGEILF